MKSVIAFLAFLLLSVSTYAQFKYETPVYIKNNTAGALTNIQVNLKVNTLALISAGWMQADGRDIRFTTACNSSTFLGHWVENYLNTDSTIIWVKVPSIGANDSTLVFMYYGNPSATTISTLTIFEGPLSATDSVVVASTNTVSNCQRGFRFTANEDILVAYFGKRIPNATQRYLTLFDFTSQAILAQIQVDAGVAGVYNYNLLTNPLWLRSGQQYVMELFNGSGDMYYYGASSQINPRLTYGDMRYQNTCTQNTFPTNTLTNIHYGCPDFMFYAKQNVTPAPTFRLMLPADTTTPAAPANLTALAGSGQATLKWNRNSEFDIGVYKVYRNTTNNPGSATLINTLPDTTCVAGGLTNGTTYYFWVTAVDRYCTPKTSAFSTVASCTPGGGLTYNVPELLYYRFHNNTPSPLATPNFGSAPVGTSPAPITGHTVGAGGMVDTCLIGAAGTGANCVNPAWNWNVTGSWTIGFWVSNLAETVSGSPTYLFGDAGSGSFRCFYGGAALPNNLYFRGPFNATGYLIPCSSPGNHYFHFVWNGTAIVIYDNGVLLQTNATANVMPTGTGFKVGGYSTSSYALNTGGKMDEFRLYNRALTQAEITATWNQELPYTVTNVEPQASVIPDKFYLSQNYPNPFNPTTTIKFGLKKDAVVELKVYDITGKEVVTLIKSQYSAGNHSIDFNASNLASGVYFYRIKAGEFMEIRRMVLIK